MIRTLIYTIVILCFSKFVRPIISQSYYFALNMFHFITSKRFVRDGNNTKTEKFVYTNSHVYQEYSWYYLKTKLNYRNFRIKKFITKNVNAFTTWQSCRYMVNWCVGHVNARRVFLIFIIINMISVIYT